MLPTDPARGETGDPITVARLFAEHAAFVWSLLRRLGVPAADAEDVCQEVFVTVHRKLPDLELRSAPRTWIYGIAVRVASDYRRSARVRREQLADTPDDGAIEAPQHAQLEVREGLAWLDATLDRLDDAKREVFVLYEVEELPMSQIADIVGCPLQTAYSRLHAARRHVQEAARRREAGGTP